jgi:hypothetical protein
MERSSSPFLEQAGEAALEMGDFAFPHFKEALQGG